MLSPIPKGEASMEQRQRPERRRDYRRELQQRRREQSAEPQPGDEQQTWPREELEQMDTAFRAAIARAARKGQ
jgi:hypothetical protein